VRKEAQAILDSLDYDFSEFDPDSFTKWVEERSGKPVHFIPAACSSLGSTGFWITDDDRHYICYQAGMPVWQEEHTKIHELCHIAAGHDTLNIGDRGVCAFLQQLAGEPESGVQLRVSGAKAHAIENDVAEAMTCLIYERSARAATERNLVDEVSSDRRLMDYLRTMGFVK
jgi:hypothetical protein